MTVDELHRRLGELPEPKLEWLEGRLAIGNDAGNLQLLRYLLQGWEVDAALPFASAALWRQALSQGFQRFAPPGPDRTMISWQSWASQLSYSPEIPAAGPMRDAAHRTTCQTRRHRLFAHAHDNHFAAVSGRDVLMRLGGSAFTPDVFAVGPGRAGWFNDHYLDGPAHLVIEVLLRGHEAYDREVKRRHYAAGGVTEYWLVDPVRQAVDFLRLDGQEYRPQSLDADGRLVVIGDLVRDRPLNVWSRITLVALDRPEQSDTWKAGSTLYTRFGDEPGVDLLEHKRATRAERHAVESEGVEV
jgi:hypothetical protein